MNKWTTNTIQSVINRLDTPFFLYDLDALKSHLEFISKNLDPDIQLWYACKANPMSAVLKIVRNLGFSIDVASLGELNQVLNTGINPKHILATGPAKSKKYLKTLVFSGVQTIVLESLNQAYWLNEIASELNISANCLMRVQLDWGNGHSVIGGDEITPFGISPKDWTKIQPRKINRLNIQGFHVFQWGNMLELSQIEKVWTQTIETIQRLSVTLHIPLEILDLGGGLGIPYNHSESSIGFGEVHQLLIKLKKKYQLKKIWMELGRYVAGEFGYYFTKIIDKKHTRGRNLLICEGGINHIARPALIGKGFPASIYENDSTTTEKFYVHGPLCTALDFLGLFEFPKNVQIGDWVIFHKVGAYGFTESMPYFLCHTLPGEVILYDGNIMIPRPPASSDNWMV